MHRPKTWLIISAINITIYAGLHFYFKTLTANCLLGFVSGQILGIILMEGIYTISKFIKRGHVKKKFEAINRLIHCKEFVVCTSDDKDLSMLTYMDTYNAKIVIAQLQEAIDEEIAVYQVTNMITKDGEVG
jgi:hypothetical protein